MEKMKILPYSTKPVTLYKWHPTYLQVADKLKSYLHKKIPDINIYHFGSTSIPGCDGKGIIDFVIIYKQNDLERIKNRVDHLGFQKQISRNPFPESRPMRTGGIRYNGKIYRIHLHIIFEGSDEIQRILSFRNLLLENAGLKQEYINLKYKIVNKGILDPTDYCQAKKSFINSLQKYRSQNRAEGK